MKWQLIVIHFLLNGLLFVGTSRSQNWSQVNGNQHRLSYVDTMLQTPLEEVQRITANGNIHSYVYYEGMAYLMIMDVPPRVCAFNLETEEEVWCRDIPSPAALNTFVPAVNDSIVLVGGQQADGLYALNRFNGDSLWFYPTGSLLHKAPVIDEDRVYISTNDGELACLDMADGGLIWSRQGVSARVIPVLDDEVIYFADIDSIIALDKLSGSLTWSLGVEGSLFPSIALQDNNLFVGYEDFIRCMNKQTGDSIWQQNFDEEKFARIFTNAFAISPETLVAKFEDQVTDSIYLRAFTTESGTFLWERLLGTGAFNSLLILGEKLIDVHRGRSRVDFYDLNSGDSLYSHPLGGILRASPIYGDGNLIISAGTELIVFAPMSTTPNREFTRFQPNLRLNPNPVVHEAVLEVDLPTDSNIRISVCSLNGMELVEIFRGMASRGTSKFKLTNAGLTSGAYLLFLKSKFGTVSQVFIQK